MFEEVLPSFLITFREALEAALIVTIMITYLRKIGKQELNKYTYIGTAGAIIISLIVGVILQVFYGGLGEVASELYEGIASLTAMAVLTGMIFWMSKHSKEIKGEMENQIEQSITQGELYSIATLAFVAVAREGLETVLFLSTTFVQDQVGAFLGAVLGILIVLGLSIMLMKGTVGFEIRKFFKVTSVLLLIFGAGLAGYGVHELIEAGENSGIDFGFLGANPFDINPPVNPDGSYPVFHENGFIGSVLKALIGYDGNPEWLRIFVYLGYWILVGSYILKKQILESESNTHTES